MRAENIHFERIYKEKDKNKFGAKCNRAKCGICTPHKKYKNNGKQFLKKRHIVELEKCKNLLKEILTGDNYYSINKNI